MSPLFAYSGHDLTPWRNNRFIVGWGGCIRRSLAEEQGPQRMLFREAVLEGFHQTRSGDRTGDKSNTDRFKEFGWKRLGCQPGPETVAVTRHGGETGDSVVANEIIDFAALDMRSAEIPLVRAKYGDDAGIAGAAALCHM